MGFVVWSGSQQTDLWKITSFGGFRFVIGEYPQENHPSIDGMFPNKKNHPGIGVLHFWKPLPLWMAMFNTLNPREGRDPSKSLEATS